MTTATVDTIPAVPVDPTGTEWGVFDDDGFIAVATFAVHNFAGGGRIEILLPRRALPADFSDSDVVVNVGAHETLRWATYADHMKAYGVFARKPAVLEQWFAVNLVDVDPVFFNGDIYLLHDGEQVGLLPRPFLVDSAGARHDLDWELDGGELTCVLPDLDPELYVGAVFDPTTVDTSTLVSASGFGNQKAVAREATGRLVAVYATTASDGRLARSDDNGASWFAYAPDIPGWANGSLFVVGTRLFVIFKQSGAGGGRTNNFIYVAHIDASAGEVAWTFAQFGGAFEDASSFTDMTYPDLVTHVEGTGWLLHGVASKSDGVAVTRVRCHSVAISAAGAFGAWTTRTIHATANARPHQWPSIALNPTKDVGIAWSTGATGAAEGIRWVKGTYAAGNITIGTERAIDTARYIDTTARWMRCLFDGTRFVIVGELYDGANYDLVAHERDAGDTATTARELSGNLATASRLDFGSATYDANANLHIFGVNQDEAAGSKDLVYRVWTRATTTLGAETVVDAGVADAYVSAKVGASSTRIEVLYRDLNASPYNVVFHGVLLNEAPTAPIWSTAAGAKDVAAALNLAAPFADPDPGDVPSAYALKRDIGGIVRWWDGTDWDATVLTWVTASDQAWVIPIGWGADGDANHSYFVAYKDVAGAGDPPVYSAALVVTPSAKVNPVLDDPDDGETIATSSYTARWTVAQQSAYLLELLNAAGTVVLWSSGWVTDTTARSRTIGFTLLNATSYRVRLTTKNTEGLESDPVVHDIDVVYDAPPVPTLVVTPVFDSVTGDRYMEITITNPAPTPPEPDLEGNDLYRRELDADDVEVTGSRIRIATDLGADAVHQHRGFAFDVTYEFLARAFGDNGTSTDSAWTS